MVLKTTNKHTFRTGYSRHSYELIEPGKIRFYNVGKGRSSVPLFGHINNIVASFMWMARGISGAIAYEQYIVASPETEEDVRNFVEDKNGKFRDAVLASPEKGFKSARILCSIMGVGMGPLNMRLVNYFTHEKDLDKGRPRSC